MTRIRKTKEDAKAATQPSTTGTAQGTDFSLQGKNSTTKLFYGFIPQSRSQIVHFHISYTTSGSHYHRVSKVGTDTPSYNSLIPSILKHFSPINIIIAPSTFLWVMFLHLFPTSPIFFFLPSSWFISFYAPTSLPFIHLLFRYFAFPISSFLSFSHNTRLLSSLTTSSTPSSPKHRPRTIGPSYIMRPKPLSTGP